MKRMLMPMIAFGLFACTGPSKKMEKHADMPPQAAGESDRSVANDDLVGYGGEPANFTFNYNGSGPELRNILQNPRSRQFRFMQKLSEERMGLLRNNLFDTGVDPETGVNCAEVMARPHRTADGKCYFHGTGVMEDKVRMGDNNARFGRNTSPQSVAANSRRYGVMDPNPREVSQKLFTRKNGQTREADIINVLAAAWLQAQNHDWFTHGKNDKNGTPLRVEPVQGDSAFPNGMRIPPTKPDRSNLGRHGYSKTFRNNVTHWWDASHIYGSDQATIDRVRTNPVTGRKYDDEGKPGHIAVDMENKRLYYDNEGLPITGFNDNWWLGLELIHSLFAMEHNHVATQLKTQNPNWDANQVFETARLIVSALIAKIHTVEWTPALLDNKVLHVGMHANWHGLRSAAGINSPFLRGVLARLSPGTAHAVSGLVGPKTLNLYGVPFTLTEEFVAVYRMHPLVPETVVAKNLNGSVAVTRPVAQTIFRNVAPLIRAPQATQKWMYGLGTGHPGGLLLNNHPTFMQNITAERNTGASSDASNSVTMDLAAVDLIRDRERGVPRYNELRRQMRLQPIARFEDLTDNAEEVRVLKEVYGDDVEKLDLLVGTLAEKDRYAGFAFGNTPFYIFALMASRRLMADPFFSDYYTADVYTRFGIDWVENQSMIDVIKRHYPALTPKFNGVSNAFRPWQPVYDQVKTRYAR